MWETTVMHKQVSGRTVNFGPNFPDQSLLRNTPPPPSPPPENWNLGRSWHFKIFQFQNNWYQWQTMCDKLPHVETLSSPDYSFIRLIRTAASAVAPWILSSQVLEFGKKVFWIKIKKYWYVIIKTHFMSFIQMIKMSQWAVFFSCALCWHHSFRNNSISDNVEELIKT